MVMSSVCLSVHLDTGEHVSALSVHTAHCRSMCNCYDVIFVGMLLLLFIITARCTLVQSVVLRSHVVRPSVRLSVRLSVTLVIQDHIGWKS